jgi:hypothetical protein
MPTRAILQASRTQWDFDGPSKIFSDRGAYDRTGSEHPTHANICVYINLGDRRCRYTNTSATNAAIDSRRSRNIRPRKPRSARSAARAPPGSSQLPESNSRARVGTSPTTVGRVRRSLPAMGRATAPLRNQKNPRSRRNPRSPENRKANQAIRSRPQRNLRQRRTKGSARFGDLLS